MAQHVIVGAGAVGSTTARHLAEAGHSVTVATRSGSGPAHPGIRLVAADATDAAALTKLAAGAQAIYNCANPPYHRWATDWPPLADSLLTAAERSGAVLVTMGNLYGYGPVDAPMTEDTPLAAAAGTKGRVRARMWQGALVAHQAGRVRATEARASDFYGPGVTGGGHLGELFVARLLAGKPARAVMGADAPHAWSYIPDVAAALITLGTDERAWGRAWHVPTAPPASMREAASRIARIAGVPDSGVRVLPQMMIRAGGLVVPLLRELGEVAYQFERPFVLDSSAFTATFGTEPTPFEEGLRETVAWWRARERAAA